MSAMVWDVRGRECSICFNHFNNGDKVAVLSCDHALCVGCHTRLQDADRETQQRALLIGLYDEPDIRETVRRNEGADCCPECRASSCAVEMVAQNYYKGIGSGTDPVVID